ncbi:unnamed protein product, partial [Mesorhabditis belari]|uniref:non-specific serine/threonine protein kinase n=1 Tax=Mesorhabditis belari TaxID=2138241 RepID=A0AAF3EB83_9BILA
MGCFLGRPDFIAGNNRVRILKGLAQGGFSEVLLAEDIDSGDKYAVKKIQVTDASDVAKVEWEISMHNLFIHPNVAPLVGSASEPPIYYLVFPYYAKGSIHDDLCRRRIKREYLPEVDVIRLFRGMCLAVECVHMKSIAHRDLKPANFLYSDDRNPILIDFGSSCKMPMTIRTAKEMQKALDDAAQNCSMAYRGPELFNCEIGTVFGTQVDIWSLGCCLYALCYFVSPFDIAHEKGNSVALAVQSPHTISYPGDAPYRPSLKTLIRKMLVVEPAERPAIKDIIFALDTLEI